MLRGIKNLSLMCTVKSEAEYHSSLGLGVHRLWYCDIVVHHILVHSSVKAGSVLCQSCRFAIESGRPRLPHGTAYPNAKWLCPVYETLPFYETLPMKLSPSARFQQFRQICTYESAVRQKGPPFPLENFSANSNSYEDLTFGSLA